ncbi:hypothetical protein M408DRAFT_14314 [Serendipita vermifera MAFF 305830]|uniref:Mitochondrial import receptor subunit TOM40 n=1 Tax=Serendipita vermifera MAFF 305830 TaxID=933852 RepID=A0A0C3BNM8_SERVB|nr:hypothetical protein M408DRAFT_14314 [Serendipita vermifera MAFF 305830]
MAFNLPPRPGTYNAGIPISDPSSSSSSFLSSLGPVRTVYDRFWGWRQSLGLPNPGNAENLQKEVKATQLTNYMFDGARADLSKVLSTNPAFQVSHAFALGSQTQEPSYNFSSLFISDRTFLQGTLDNDGNVSGRFTQQWSSSEVTKGQMQLGASADRSLLQVEHEHSGLDYTMNAKAVNPSPIDGSGVYIGSYLQSVTKHLALGVETIFQRAPEGSEIASTYLVKYTGGQSTWIATAQFQTLGLLQASYYHKLSSQVEVAADLQLIAAPMKRDAVATVGAKWDLRMATFKAQLDSGGKVSAMLEQRFAPNFAFLLTGEIDHFKNAAKVGVGIMLEMNASPEDTGLPPQL